MPEQIDNPPRFPVVETYDYSLFGAVEIRPLNKIRRVIARRMHASWVNVPMVVQFDEADITELEVLHDQLKPKADAAGVRLTLLAFVVKACVLSLKAFPEFNASLDATGDNLVLKKYFNIGFATDTPYGLIAPVVKNADKKELFQLAAEISNLAVKARSEKLAFSETEGGCFSITNLGRLGGTAFTPTINAPEVAVLGMARATRKMIDMDNAFVPRLMLPLSLAYDHRVIDGAVGGRFMDDLRKRLATPAALAI
ncbi:2-oxo acid dehydrogenase subunit E2 [Roseiarcaceae bacterium H3SJ34-1]|uniref:2-oxo acid dehydrogenase subunit E2 n=1 Tax=Terripilifer ovatus TaxID=3032367 RepID=UPI003AB9323A|nr:2-oxo acid dehydrogenase subunit E2 [Roseiarcaceae bacterium H3SJ34-1]